MSCSSQGLPRTKSRHRIQQSLRMTSSDFTLKCALQPTPVQTYQLSNSTLKVRRPSRKTGLSHDWWKSHLATRETSPRKAESARKRLLCKRYLPLDSFSQWSETPDRPNPQQEPSHRNVATHRAVAISPETRHCSLCLSSTGRVRQNSPENFHQIQRPETHED